MKKITEKIVNWKLNYTNSKKIVSFFRCINCEKKLIPEKMVYFRPKETKYYTYALNRNYVIALIACKCGSKIFFKVDFDESGYDYSVNKITGKSYSQCKKLFKGKNVYSVNFKNMVNGVYDSIKGAFGNAVW